jgi:hypothetical protein
MKFSFKEVQIDPFHAGFCIKRHSFNYLYRAIIYDLSGKKLVYFETVAYVNMKQL